MVDFSKLAESGNKMTNYFHLSIDIASIWWKILFVNIMIIHCHLTVTLSHVLFPNLLLCLCNCFCLSHLSLSLYFQFWYMMFAFSWLFPICFFQTSCFLGLPTPPTQSVKRPENTLTFLYLDTKYEWHFHWKLLAKSHQLKQSN